MAQGKVEICGVNTSKLPLLKEDEKEALLLRIKAGDMEAKEEYIKGNLRLVLSVIKRFSNANENPDDLFPTIYRVDRIQSFRVTDEHFQVPYLERFQEGEFRKRVQFMYGGKLQTTRFTYSGPSIESVLDRLPTAKILSEENGVYTVEAETFGKGVDMWLRSQGEWVNILIQKANKS